MISFIFLSAFVFVSRAEQVQEAGTSASEDVGQRVLTNAGYMIKYGDTLYRYPLPARIIPPAERNPTETNEIENEDDDKRRPLFYFTSYEPEEGSSREALPTSRPYIEIRRKRDVDDATVPESSKIGKLRRKRTYCGKCGKGGGGYGGYGGYYVPVTYVVYPMYYGGGGGGGRGKGCYTCGGGGGGFGGGGSYSYSHSSASSSAGSFGWGKK